MSPKLKALLDRKAAKVAEARALIEQAESEDRDLNEEEQTQFAAAKQEIAALQARIERQKEVDAEEAALAAAGPRLPKMDFPENASVSGGRPRAEDDPKHGFKSVGDFAMAVYRAADPRGRVIDERLNFGAAPTTYSGEGAGADGGYVIPPGFSAEIRRFMDAPDNFLGMTDDIPVSGNSMSFPTDETTPWGSNGVRAFWEAESAQATQTKTKLGLRTLRLRKLFALAPVTDELLSDAAALAAYLPNAAGRSIRYKANDSLINGTGDTQPLGFMNAAALVTVAKETSQTAATINAANVSNMFARMLPESMGRAVWIVSHTAWAQLPQLTVGNMPVWQPNYEQSPGGVLFGRPVYISQSMQTLGTVGDIALIDWQQYVTIRKALETATSMHLWFDYDVTAFRAIFRIDGQPWMSAARSPAKGSAAQSPFVVLATRS